MKALATIAVGGDVRDLRHDRRDLRHDVYQKRYGK